MLRGNSVDFRRWVDGVRRTLSEEPRCAPPAAAGQVVASRRGYKQKEFTRIEKTGGDDTEVTENTVQLVTVERVGEEQLMLGSKNTIRTVIKVRPGQDAARCMATRRDRRTARM